ncbi:hypothetical protein WDU94_001036 [Cyamophila willieti]
MCTVARAKVILISLTLLALALYSPYLFISGPQINLDTRQNTTIVYCGLVQKWKDLATLLNHVDLILTLIVPFTLIVVLNTLISRTVWRVARIRRSMINNNNNNKMGGGATSAASVNHHHQSVRNNFTSHNTQKLFQSSLIITICSMFFPLQKLFQSSLIITICSMFFPLQKLFQSSLIITICSMFFPLQKLFQSSLIITICSMFFPLQKLFQSSLIITICSMFFPLQKLFQNSLIITISSMFHLFHLLPVTETVPELETQLNGSLFPDQSDPDASHCVLSIHLSQPSFVYYTLHDIHQ